MVALPLNAAAAEETKMGTAIINAAISNVPLSLAA
jgi:hypothetical protein